MRLCFLDSKSKTAINITRLRKYNFETRRIIADWQNKLAGLIVLCNGTPDDIVLGILAYHLNGTKVVGIVKPSNKRHLSSLSETKTYLDLNVTKIFYLIDQEDFELDDLFSRIESEMQNIGIEYTLGLERERVRIYNCILPNKSFTIAIVVNGLSEIVTDKHCIEDHLIKAGDIQNNQDTKATWESLIDQTRNNVFRKLKTSEIATEIFIQQRIGLDTLFELSN
jgi:hypothetical protein